MIWMSWVNLLRMEPLSLPEKNERGALFGCHHYNPRNSTIRDLGNILSHDVEKMVVNPQPRMGCNPDDSRPVCLR